jgi:hypothetical protein
VLPTSLECGFEGNEAAPPANCSNLARELCRRLEALAFEPLGVKWEQIGLRARTREVSYACQERQAFASIFAFEGSRPRLYFVTPFQDGAVVLTGCYRRSPLHSDLAIATGLPGADVGAALEAHARNVQEMASKGHLPFDKWAREERLAATQLWYENRAWHPADFRLAKRAQSILVVTGIALFIAGGALFREARHLEQGKMTAMWISIGLMLLAACAIAPARDIGRRTRFPYGRLNLRRIVLRNGVVVAMPIILSLLVSLSLRSAKEQAIRQQSESPVRFHR